MSAKGRKTNLVRRLKNGSVEPYSGYPLLVMFLNASSTAKRFSAMFILRLLSFLLPLYIIRTYDILYLSP